jgi:hypothetical protein
MRPRHNEPYHTYFLYLYRLNIKFSFLNNCVEGLLLDVLSLSLIVHIIPGVILSDVTFDVSGAIGNRTYPCLPFPEKEIAQISPESWQCSHRYRHSS